MVKQKSRYSCKSTIYFDLGPDFIKENCKFAFYYNETDITPTVLDGGNDIILANWPNDKQIICNVNNDIPVKIPSHPYMPVNRSVLCNCGIEVENNFLLESLAAFQDLNSKLVIYFMVNTSFFNYLDQLDNFTDTFWHRFVDDTFVIHKHVNKQGFLQHINSVDPAIRFTVEDNKEDGSISFLDTIVKPEADGTLSITVYRKPTHTDQYIQWDSHHHFSAKFSVNHTLSHRASTVCSKPDLLQQEKDHLRKALTKCKYPKWALDKVEKRLNRSTRQVTDGGTTGAQPATNEAKNKGHIVIPYTQGLCESIKKICGRYGIQTHFKGGRTIKNLLVSPKDKDPMVNQSGAIYWYQCGDLGCDEEYIGETSRIFGERYKEHLKAPSAIHHHSSQTGHPH